MVSKADQENRMALVTQIARLCPHVSASVIAADVRKLGTIGKRAHRHAERMCSEEGYYNAHTDEDGNDTLDDKLEAQAQKIASKYGLQARTAGDPRGFVLYVTGKGIRGNTWGGDEHGFGIN